MNLYRAKMAVYVAQVDRAPAPAHTHPACASLRCGAPVARLGAGDAAAGLTDVPHIHRGKPVAAAALMLAPARCQPNAPYQVNLPHGMNYHLSDIAARILQLKVHRPLPACPLDWPQPSLASPSDARPWAELSSEISFASRTTTVDTQRSFSALPLNTKQGLHGLMQLIHSSSKLPLRSAAPPPSFNCCVISVQFRAGSS